MALAEAPKDDESIRPFTVVYNERKIAQLREELARVKWFEPLEGMNYRDGVNTKTFRDVMEYWRTKFDFEKAQNDINAYPHFKSEIEGTFRIRWRTSRGRLSSVSSSM